MDAFFVILIYLFYIGAILTVAHFLILIWAWSLEEKEESIFIVAWEGENDEKLR